MPHHREYCDPREWLKARRDLADALTSGRFRQQPIQTDRIPMRDDQDRYTISGVAASLSTNVWIRLEDQWHTVWFNEISELKLADRQQNGDISGLNEMDQARILDRTSGDVLYMPENTACTLGLHEDPEGHEHPSELQIHPNAFPTEIQQKLDLPKRKDPYPADYLSFEQAAELINRHPMALGPCGCEQLDINDDESAPPGAYADIP